MKKIFTKLICAVILGCAALPAYAQDSALFGIWRGEVVTPGDGSTA